MSFFCICAILDTVLNSVTVVYGKLLFIAASLIALSVFPQIYWCSFSLILLT